MRRCYEVGLPGIVIFLLIVATGCYPMEIPVSSTGDLVIARAEGFLIMNGVSGEGTLLAVGAEDAPAFAALSPDGTLLARAVQKRDEEGSLSSRSIITIGLRSDTETRRIAEVDNACFVQVAPDNKSVSYAFVSGQPIEGIDEALPELRLVSAPAGEERIVSRNVSIVHRWLPDGRLIFLKTEKKEEQSRIGALAVFNPADGKTTRIVSILNAEWFEVSPDGREAILSAAMVTAAGETPVVSEEDSEKKLFVVDLVEGTIRKLEVDAVFCRYSPDGSRIAILRKNTVEVTDRAWSVPPRLLLRGAVTDLENSTKVHLSWLNNSEVLALRKKAIYGANGFTLELVACAATTGRVRSLQESIERLAVNR